MVESDSKKKQAMVRGYIHSSHSKVTLMRFIAGGNKQEEPINTEMNAVPLTSPHRSQSSKHNPEDIDISCEDDKKNGGGTIILKR